MAEYVRRKRPPATHPYWARLHDRANPPGVVGPVAVPGGLAGLLGLYAGLNKSLPAAEALEIAVVVAGGIAAVVSVTSLPIFAFGAVRYMTPRERWPTATIEAAVAGVVTLFAVVGPLALLLLSYAACSGRGPWSGLLIGLAIGGVPGTAYAWWARRRWRKRQQQWPRWDRMRAPRTLPLPSVLVPAEPAPAAESEPDRAEGPRVGE
jgi:hypothetical protein